MPGGFGGAGRLLLGCPLHAHGALGWCLCWRRSALVSTANGHLGTLQWLYACALAVHATRSCRWVLQCPQNEGRPTGPYGGTYVLRWRSSSSSWCSSCCWSSGGSSCSSSSCSCWRCWLAAGPLTALYRCRSCCRSLVLRSPRRAELVAESATLAPLRGLYRRCWRLHPLRVKLTN